MKKKKDSDIDVVHCAVLIERHLHPTVALDDVNRQINRLVALYFWGMDAQQADYYQDPANYLQIAERMSQIMYKVRGSTTVTHLGITLYVRCLAVVQVALVACPVGPTACTCLRSIACGQGWGGKPKGAPWLRSFLPAKITGCSLHRLVKHAWFSLTPKSRASHRACTCRAPQVQP